MDSYTQKMNFFGNTDPEELVTKYGSPLFVYNEDILRRQEGRNYWTFTVSPAGAAGTAYISDLIRPAC